MTAVAALELTGRPRLVAFDELTTGLDPAARRESWKVAWRLFRWE